METSTTSVAPGSIPASNFIIVEGIKGTIDTHGGAAVADASVMHVDEYLSTFENPNDCTRGRDCHVQIGWILGTTYDCANQPQPYYAPTVFVEIFDDSANETPSGNPCTFATFGSAPRDGASYDARYYSTISAGGTYYHYKAFYQIPGQTCCQVLGWGDFKDQTSVQLAGTEVESELDNNGNALACPVVAGPGYQVDYGLGTSPSTFASTLALYKNGGWVDWTSAYAPSSYFSTPDVTRNRPGPYQISPTTNFKQFGANGPVQ